MNDRQEKLSNRSLTARLLVFAVGMFAFGFLVLPPLYEVFCDLTGFGSRGATTAQVAVEQPDLARTVRIEFVTTVNEYAPWSFAADVDSMEVHPGKMYFATFSATNRADRDLVSPARSLRQIRHGRCHCSSS
jgi:cytochrome c oxidase assembly protein subunit 11